MSLSRYDPRLGRRSLKRGYACPEYEPYAKDECSSPSDEENAIMEARRRLLSLLPPPSLLPEAEFPSIAMGGRCLDKWGYRWGQRSGDLWFFVVLPEGTDVSNINVDFRASSIEVSISGVSLNDGLLWNVEDRRGVDPDSGGWLVVTHEQHQILHVEVNKKRDGWWKALWAKHPTIEVYEIPFWKDNTFGDGYHQLTKTSSSS